MNDNIEIRYHELHKFFQQRHLLDDLSLTLNSGAVTLLCGENGSGKTTLLRILSGLEKPARCMVELVAAEHAGEPMPWAKCRKMLQQQVMYLHQQPYMFDGDVIRNLALALPHSMPKSRRDRNLIRALDWAQLDGIAESRAKTLSSGEKQRVSLARAWLRQAKVLLLDEPIANMDRESCERTVSLLKQLKLQGVAIMIASHNHEIFDALVDRCLVLENGKLNDVSAIALPDNVTPLSQPTLSQSTAMNRVSDDTL